MGVSKHGELQGKSMRSDLQKLISKQWKLTLFSKFTLKAYKIELTQQLLKESSPIGKTNCDFTAAVTLRLIILTGYANELVNIEALKVKIRRYIHETLLKNSLKRPQNIWFST